MSPGKDLFNLIRSLSKTEQRYISLSLKQDAEKNYARLFSVIASQDSYDEKAVKQSFKTEHFAFTKNYLHNLILKLLRNYYSDSNISVSLLNKLIDVEVLIEKGFYKAAFKRTKSVIVLARENELFYVEAMAQSQIKKLFYHGVHETDAELVKRTEVEVIEELTNLIAFENINLDNYLNNIYHGLFLKNKTADSPRKRMAALKIKPQSLTAQYYYLNSVIAFYGNNRQFNSEFHTAITQCVQLFEANPGFAKLKPFFVINAYNSKALTEVLTNNMKAAAETIEKMEALDQFYKFKLTPKVKVKLFELIIPLKFEYFYETRQFDLGISILPDVMEKLHQVDNYTINPTIVERVQDIAAMFYFIDRQYKKSIKIAHDIINDEFNKRKDVLQHAKLLLFINHLELKNADVFRYLLKLYPPKRNSIESVLLNFIDKEIIGERSKKELTNKWKKILSKVSVHPALQKMKSYFEVDNWIESKIRNLSFKEIMIGK